MLILESILATEVWEKLGSAPNSGTQTNTSQRTTGPPSWQGGAGQPGAGAQLPGGGAHGGQQQVPNPRAQTIALVFTQFK